MKKAAAVLLAVVMFFCGCEYGAKTPENEKEDTVTGVWLSAYEIEDMLNAGFTDSFEKLVENLKQIHVNRLYLHIRAFGETLCKSAVFPQSKLPSEAGFDIISYMLNRLNKENISVYAWINPYRISTNENLSEPQKELIQNFESTDICYFSGGVYLNPASNNVRKKLLEFIREVTENYAFDGIHFDDYFYPTTDSSFDEKDYNNYCLSSLNPVNLDDYRRANVTALISSVSACLKGKDKKFSISPSASVENNYSRLYADVISWCNSNLIDEVVPQLYFGFCHTQKEYCFEALFEAWQSRIYKSKVKFLVGLSAYKVGTQNASDGDEWLDGAEILASQARYACNHNADGYVIFSASSLFSEQPLNIKQKEYLIEFQGELI